MIKLHMTALPNTYNTNPLRWQSPFFVLCSTLSFLLEFQSLTVQLVPNTPWR